jgi:cephalosporin hydroxylase
MPKPLTVPPESGPYRGNAPANPDTSEPVLLPSGVSLPLDATILDLWRARGHQSQTESYAGLRLVKFPEDLRVYEHILWGSTPEVVIELGTQSGGSALWFRDRLRMLASYGRIRGLQVIAVDIDMSATKDNLAAVDAGYADTIVLVEGDVQDPAIAAHVAALIKPGTSVLIVEDSAHTYETTTAALTGYSDLVQRGGWFVVEDGGVDIEAVRLDPAWPRGVIPAIHDWLQTPAGRRFTMRRDMELYGLTSNPEGFLQRMH